jgi:uncharacterized protein YndB with AHSA1/START domain
MSTTSEVPADQPTIEMSRIYDAPRARVWEAITQPKHVRQWWGGAGVSNPVCEIDLRPGGLWTHVMRFPDGREMRMKFIFVEIVPPERLVWEHAEPGADGSGPPACRFTVALQDLGGRTRWHLVTRFQSLSERDAAVAAGFRCPIAASNEQFAEYLEAMGART